MTDQNTYDKLVAQTWETITELGKKKGAEYSGDQDRLGNFRRNGERLNLPMEVVWAVYFMKHIDAIMQYVQDLHTGKHREHTEPISGRVDDAIVYLMLFKAMLQERDS